MPLMKPSLASVPFCLVSCEVAQRKLSGLRTKGAEVESSSEWRGLLMAGGYQIGHFPHCS